MSEAAIPLNDMAAAAEKAADALRALSNPSRLMILCKLVEGPASVGELVDALSMNQAYVSQQLARLRTDGLVSTTREGRSIIYALSDPRITPILNVLYEQFCSQPTD